MYFREWLDILLYKKKPAELASTSLGEGLKHLAIASAIVGLLSGIQSYLLMSAAAGLIGAAGVAAGIGLVIGSIIVTPIMAVIGAIIGGGILHVFSMILGGTGSYANYVGVLSKISAALEGTLGLVIVIIGILSLLGGFATYLAVSPLIFLLLIVYVLWCIALTVMATQVVQKISVGRALIAVVVIPLVIGIVLALIAGAVALAFLISAMDSGAGTGLAGLLL